MDKIGMIVSPGQIIAFPIKDSNAVRAVSVFFSAA